MTSVSAIAASAARCGRSWAAPNEQLRPMVSGRAWRTACPERLDRVAGQVAARQIGEGHRQHDRQRRGRAPARPRSAAMIAGLGVERVEHRLDQDEVDAALDQRVDLLAIDRLQRVEIDLAKARIVDVGRQRQRLVGRPDRAGDPARPAVAAPAQSSATARAIRAAARLISRDQMLRRHNRPG